ncbi:hypothetical protein K270103H11_16740 [Gordonibacter urolithinfaciens]
MPRAGGRARRSARGIVGSVASGVGEGGSRSARTRAASSRTAPDRAYRKAFVERRPHGMKGLQRGMGGAVIGFSDLSAEGVLRAKAIVGNDDASSGSGENMPAA